MHKVFVAIAFLLMVHFHAFAYDAGAENDMADAIESVSGPASGQPGNDPYDMPPSPLGDLYDIGSGPAPAPAGFFEQLQNLVDAWNAYLNGTGPFPSYNNQPGNQPPKKVTFYATARSKRSCAHFLAMSPIKRCTKLGNNRYRLKIIVSIYETYYGTSFVQGE
jgi:hypothetical protein